MTQAVFLNKDMHVGQVLCSVHVCDVTVWSYLRSPPFMMVMTRQSSSFVWKAYANDTIKRLCTFSSILFSTIAPCRSTSEKTAVKGQWGSFSGRDFSFFLFFFFSSSPLDLICWWTWCKRMGADKWRARHNCAKKFHSEELSTKAPRNHSIPVSVV